MHAGALNIPDPDEYELDRQLETGTAPDEYFGRLRRGIALTSTEHLCPRCGGSGEVSWLRRPPGPQTEETARCPTCQGQGVLHV